MSVVNSTPLLLGDDGYQISRSVRLRSSASAYFNRTPASASNRKTWTWSGWVKRGSLTSSQWLFAAGPISTEYTIIRFGSGGASNDNLEYVKVVGSAIDAQKISTAVYRDPSSWYHIVVVEDAANTVARIYVNGSEVSYSTNDNPTNVNGAVNNTVSHEIGRYVSSAGTQQFDGYLAEVNFIDGQALTPSSFGETNAVTGIWKPKKYAGTYGTNGFYLNFSDNSAATAAAIGKDRSGNGNNWTPNNISVTAGATYDSMLDVPTMWADGGNGRGNYAVLNPLNRNASTTLSAGNLTYSATSAASFGPSFGSIAVSSGKWYWEVTLTSIVTASNFLMIGIDLPTRGNGNGFPGDTVSGLAYYSSNGNKYQSNTATAYGATFTQGDVIGVALDLDAGSLTFYKNNVSQGIAFSSITGTWVPAISVLNSASAININFGQRPFAYTPPTGFKALNTQNLPDATIVKGSTAFNIALDTGANIKTSTEALFGTNYLEWIKDRANANNHQLLDTVRGTTAVLQSNTTAAETTYLAPAGSSVGWAWKEGTTQGFDIVTYTGNGTSQNIPHNLGVAPKFIITKNRSASSGWLTYHSAVGAGAYLSLASTSASTADASVWNNTAPTSSVFSVGSPVSQNTNNYVAYCFTEVAGYSKFGSYTGNGSADGPFVYCGFMPRYVLVKRTDTTGDWIVYDTARDTYNASKYDLSPNSSAAESPLARLDILSNGWKWRDTSAGRNASGGTYIYMAFAENPFKYSLAR